MSSSNTETKETKKPTVTVEQYLKAIPNDDYVYRKAPQSLIMKVLSVLTMAAVIQYINTGEGTNPFAAGWDPQKDGFDDTIEFNEGETMDDVNRDKLIEFESRMPYTSSCSSVPMVMVLHINLIQVLITLSSLLP
jgi:hypothetical protein